MFKLINKYIIAIACFYIIWLGAFPVLITKSVEVLCKNFSANSSYEINLISPKVKLYPIPCAKFGAKKLVLKKKNSKNEFLAENFNFKIRLLPLLSGKLHFNKINCENLEIIAQIDENTVFNKEILNNLKYSSVEANSLKLNKFSTQLYKKDGKAPKYEGKDLIFSKKNKYVILKFDSILTINNRKSDIKINLLFPRNNNIDDTIFEVNVNNINLNDFEDYFKIFIDKNIASVNGIINVSADKGSLIANLKNCAITMKDISQSIIFPSDTYIKSNFGITSNEINLKEFLLNSSNINVNVSGKIKDYFSKSAPNINLNIVLNKSRIEDFVKMMPSFKVEEFDSFKLKKYMFYGDILGNITVKGKLPEPDLYGDIFVDNGILIKPIPNATKGARVKLSLKGRSVDYDVFVPAGGAQKVVVKGTQEIYNIKYGELTVKSSDSVNLHSAQEVVTPLSEILNFVIGPVPIMDVYGVGNIDITVKGNRKNPHVWGILNFNNADAKFVQIPDLVLNKADAILSFSDKNAMFENKKGLVNKVPFDIKGVCDLSGKFDFSAKSTGQPTEELYKAFLTTTMLGDINKHLPKADRIIGSTDLDLKIYGNVKYIRDLCFNKNAFASGKVTLKNNDITALGTTFQKVNADIYLDGLDSDSTVRAYVDGLPLNVSAKIKNNISDVNLDIPRLNPNFILKNYFGADFDYLPFVSIKGKYKGRFDKIEYENLNMTSEVLYSPDKSPLNFNSGTFTLNNGTLNVKNVYFHVIDSTNSIKTSFKADEIFSKNPNFNGTFDINLPDLKVVNKIFGSGMLPKNLKTYIKDTEFKSGSLILKGKIANNKVLTSYDLSGISFVYIPLELPIKILNGKISLNNDRFKFSGLNILADDMPIFINGEIKDLYDKKNFNVYVNSKPKQEFIDKYINKKQIYPLKLRGDVVFRAYAKGMPANFDFKSVIEMYKGSAIYYYGASVGDIENELQMSFEGNLKNKKTLKIKEFIADKIINSQSSKKTPLNMLRITGTIDILDDDLLFNDFRIKTSNPTDAKVFNLLFGKPNIKNGRFSSDLKLSGKLSNPKILGTFHIVETDIPFIDTTMKNIEFTFKDKTIELYSKGEVLGNDVTAKALLTNKLTPPYHIIKAEVYTKDMDLNRIISKLKYAGVETELSQESFGILDFNSIIADHLKLKADHITLRNIHASDFLADTSLSRDKVFNINNFVFNIAQGHLEGKYTYNIKTNDIKVNLDADKINADDIAWALFDLKNQIYGDMTGTVNLSCTGWSYENCLATLNGNTIFNVKNGRMPKLGSLEYLLKAGNLIKGGITNLSINGVIDLITPLKTGEFSDIYGSITIRDGIANDIEITTQGKDMNLFIGGTYNFSDSNAEMEVLGMISRKLSTMLGPVGNLSINTLFNMIPGVDLSKDSEIRNKINKIPGIEISGKAYRKFVAEIKGNINAEDYVTSFKWIN